MRHVCAGVMAVCLLTAATVTGSDRRQGATPNRDDASTRRGEQKSGAEGISASRLETSDSRARDVLAAARMIIAGTSGSGDVRTLTIAGRATRALGPMQLSGSFTLHVALPDRSVRIDRLSMAGVRAEIASGFDGTSLIQRASSASGISMDTDALLPVDVRDAARSTALLGAKQDLAILMLGLMSDSFAFYPMQFTYAGTADAPEGSADVIEARGADGLAVRLFVDSRTHRPLMVSWDGPDVAGAARQLMAAPRATMPTRADIDALALAPPVEHRMYFEAPRRSGTRIWPSLVRRAVAGVTTEEMRIEQVTVNPSLDVSLFETGR